MKKTKLMALVLVGAISLTGAGYAAWSNTITDTTSINTGKWSVVLENDSQNSFYAGDQVNTFARTGNGTAVVDGQSQFNPQYGIKQLDGSYKNYDTDGSYRNNTGSPNYVYTIEPTMTDTTCTFNFKNMHPGTQAMTRFEIRNKGTIPAKIEAVHVTFWNGNTQITDLSDNNNSAEAQVIRAMKVDPYFQIHRGEGATTLPLNIASCDLKDLQTTLNSALKGKILKPEDFTSTVVSDELEASKYETQRQPIFTFNLPADSLKADNTNLNSANLGMDANFQIKIVFDFVQYNDITNDGHTAVTSIPAQPQPTHPGHSH